MVKVEMDNPKSEKDSHRKIVVTMVVHWAEM